MTPSWLLSGLAEVLLRRASWLQKGSDENGVCCVHWAIPILTKLIYFRFTHSVTPPLYMGAIPVSCPSFVLINLWFLSGCCPVRLYLPLADSLLGANIKAPAWMHLLLSKRVTPLRWYSILYLWSTWSFFPSNLLGNCTEIQILQDNYLDVITCLINVAMGLSLVLLSVLIYIPILILISTWMST